jgi:hypothetical protein
MILTQHENMVRIAEATSAPSQTKNPSTANKPQAAAAAAPVFLRNGNKAQGTTGEKKNTAKNLFLAALVAP